MFLLCWAILQGCLQGRIYFIFEKSHTNVQGLSDERGCHCQGPVGPIQLSGEAQLSETYSGVHLKETVQKIGSNCFSDWLDYFAKNKTSIDYPS